MKGHLDVDFQNSYGGYENTSLKIIALNHTSAVALNKYGHDIYLKADINSVFKLIVFSEWFKDNP